MGERLRMPLLEDGGALVQPVYVGDVAAAIMAATEDPERFNGKTIELAGPAEYSRAEIAAFVNDITKQNKEPVPFPKPVLSLVGMAVEMLWDPYLTKDDVEVMGLDLTCDAEAASAAGVLTFADMPEIEPTPVEKIAFQYLHRYRKGGHFVYAAGYH